MSYEYIASGTSFMFKNSLKDIAENKELVSLIQKFTDIVVSLFDNHKFGVLFNGYTEKGFGGSVNKIFSPYTIQVDSGGLQMITLGRTITPELKREVYSTQATYGNVGMCFDEIPVRTNGSRMVDTKQRYFDPSMFESCAKQTGENLTEQIIQFREQKTSCRPMMIIQGNGMDWYRKWADIVLKTIPIELHEDIKGVSVGSPSFGNGLLEDIEKVFTLSILDIPDHMKKYNHLLGFGSMNRLISVIEFKRSGLFGDDIVFSYDSTKHTSGVMRGQYQRGPKIVQMSRYKDNVFREAYELISKFSSEVLGYEFDEELFYQTICLPNGDWEKIHGSKSHKLLERNIHPFIFFIYSVHEVMKYVKLMEEDEYFICQLRPNDHEFLFPLKQVKTLDDFNYWKSHAGRKIDSRRIGCLSSSLDDFFV